MAGRPKVRADKARLLTLTTGDADSIFEMVGDAVPLAKVAEAFQVGKTALLDWIEATPDRMGRYNRARERRATTHFEKALEIADEGVNAARQTPDGSPAEITDAARKNAITTHLWGASRLDRKTYGEQKGPDVVINMATLHLDALRRRPVEPTTYKVIESSQVPSATVNRKSSE